MGTYYYPGWRNLTEGATDPFPWNLIKKDFKETKQPLIGWYDNSSDATMLTQINYMVQYGLDYVVFDWYWFNKQRLNQALDAFQRVNTGQLKYTILWDNSFTFPYGLASFDQMVDIWINNLFSDPNFLTIDSKPVVFIFGVEYMKNIAADLATTPAALLTRASDRAKAAGYTNGIYFVGGTAALSHWVTEAVTYGFSALTAYNYHYGYSGEASTRTPYMAHSYTELSEDYRLNWDWILRKSSLPYIVPMSSGWDKRPWGGSSDPLHDNIISTPSEFRDHLVLAKQYMDSYSAKSKGMGIVCCWNEFGEGSYIEPTTTYGTQYLEQIFSVFN